MDADGLRDRIAESLVERIFRRAGYHAVRVPREGRALSVPERACGGLTACEDGDALPDLLLCKDLPAAELGPSRHRLLAVDVAYRADIGRALVEEREALARSAGAWGDRYLVFVTDRPEPGRACFQVVDARRCLAGAPAASRDLHRASELDLSWAAVEECERLVTLTFPVLSCAARRRAAEPFWPAEPPQERPLVAVAAEP